MVYPRAPYWDLLFNISINDLFFFVENSQVCNYADDNSLTVADVDLDKIIGRLETDIVILDRWLNNKINAIS